MDEIWKFDRSHWHIEKQGVLEGFGWKKVRERMRERERKCVREKKREREREGRGERESIFSHTYVLRG